MESSVHVNQLKEHLQDEEKKEETIIVYESTHYKWTDIFLISAEPVWYLTILSVEFITIWIYLYTNVDTQCHDDKWYVTGMRGKPSNSIHPQNSRHFSFQNFYWPWIYSSASISSCRCAENYGAI